MHHRLVPVEVIDIFDGGGSAHTEEQNEGGNRYRATALVIMTLIVATVTNVVNLFPADPRTAKSRQRLGLRDWRMLPA